MPQEMGFFTPDCFTAPLLPSSPAGLARGARNTPQGSGRGGWPLAWALASLLPQELRLVWSLPRSWPQGRLRPLVPRGLVGLKVPSGRAGGWNFLVPSKSANSSRAAGAAAPSVFAFDSNPVALFPEPEAWGAAGQGHWIVARPGAADSSAVVSARSRDQHITDMGVKIARWQGSVARHNPWAGARSLPQ